MADVGGPLKILSLDGGGIRGVSSLLILEHIMEKIRIAKGLECVPRPCDYFHLIGGTSTGGIIAIMLGRLGMTVDECIRAYKKVAQQAFTPKKTTILPASPAGTFSAKALEAAIKKVVREVCAESTCLSRRSQGFSTIETCPHGETVFRDSSCTKTVVLAITADNVDGPPTLFTTYDTSAGLTGCKIWEVARATSAATTFFKPIRVGRDDVNFIDAAFGYNNPCEVLLEEARRQYPGDRKLRILSIGTGLGDTSSISKTRTSIIKALKKMATSSKKVAMRLENQFGGSGQYYRFNVDRGLQDVTLSDWDKVSEISAHTKNFLSENQKPIQEFVDVFIDTTCEHRAQLQNVTTQARELPSAATIDATNTIPNSSMNSRNTGPRYHIPLRRNKRFVGRENTLATLTTKLFTEKCQSVAIIGLGGVGKTQVALELAYWTEKRHPECSIFWVPALSEATFEQAFTDIARILNLDRRGNIDIKETVQRHLSSEIAGQWLLIVDNADDLELICEGPETTDALERYLPQSDNGRIIFTTRSRDVAQRVAEETVKLDELSVLEAEKLLEEMTTQKDLTTDQSLTTALLHELAYLPLAITQAAAYIERNQVSIAEYLRLLHNTENDMADLLSEEFPDKTRYKGSKNAVASTWIVSFNKIHDIDSNAAALLSFMAQIEPKAIPQSLLPRLGSEVQVAGAIGTLCAYSLVSRRDEMLDMHSLIYSATQIWLNKEGLGMQTRRTAIRHVAAVFPSTNFENRHTWRLYLPHALRLLQQTGAEDMEERFDLYFRVGLCLLEDGRIKESLRCLEEHWQWTRDHFGQDHPYFLSSQYELADAYQKNGRIKEAVDMLEYIVEKKALVLSEEHPDRLTSLHALAGAYKRNGQIKKAIRILEYIVEKEALILPEENHDRLASQHALAGAYIENGQINKAIDLLEYIVTKEALILPDEHPDRLASQHELARAYLTDKQVAKAIELLKWVVTLRKQSLAEDHRALLTSQQVLGVAYQVDGQVAKAVELLERVVMLRKQTLAEDHPKLLTSQHSLAVAYQQDGQIDKAIGLLQHVVAVEARVLEDDDPSRLASISALEDALQAAGQ